MKRESQKLKQGILRGMEVDAETCANMPLRFPTPTAGDWKAPGAKERHHARMEERSQPLSEFVGGLLNPPWVEWLMGWPIGWTELKPLEMDKFREWLRSHGKNYQEWHDSNLKNIGNSLDEQLPKMVCGQFRARPEIQTGNDAK